MLAAGRAVPRTADGGMPGRGRPADKNTPKGRVYYCIRMRACTLGEARRKQTGNSAKHPAQSTHENLD